MTTQSAERLRCWLRWGVALALLLWFVLIYAYFLRTNFPLLHNAEQTFGVFSGLFGRYSFSWGNSPALEILQSLIVLGLTQALGLFLVRALQLPLDRVGKFCVAFPLGFGISGIAFELLTMAGGLYSLPAWALWAVMLGSAFWLQRKSPPVFLGEVFLPEHVEEREPEERNLADRIFFGAAWTFIGLISAATLWHGAFFPETYWDSLILYLGYGRMTFLEHAFPFKAEAQVGIGLGANYPHLFSTYGAMASTLFGQWSDLHQRLICPLMGILTCVLIYKSVERITGSRTIAVACALLFRAVPYGIYYTTTASDYAFALLFVAAFILLLVVMLEKPTAGTVSGAAAIPAIAMHLNYLMGVLWPAWIIGIILLWWRSKQEGHSAGSNAAVRRVAAIFLIAVAAASPWYFRNWILTGNPVYSFFPEIFRSSVRINVEVLRSAELEWFRNGDGIGRLAELYHDIETQQRRQENDPGYRREAGLGDRIRASFLYWVGFDIADFNGEELSLGDWLPRLMHLVRVWELERGETYSPSPGRTILINRHSYKTLPLFAGLVFPSILLLLYYLPKSRPDLGSWPQRAALFLVLVLFLSFLCYHYVLADFYLYQIIPVLVMGTVLTCPALVFWRRTQPWVLRVFLFLCLIQAVHPGLAFSLMNFKLVGEGTVEGQTFSPMRLDAFRNPGLPPEIFMRLRFGPDVDMWDFVNDNLKGQKILSHENRHYVFDPTITFAHLDDWEIQKGYGLSSPEETAEFLKGQGIRYYLRVENEAAHWINRRLGMDALIDSPHMREVYRAGPNVLYEIR